jgi:signal transduction histidine kinase
MSELAELIHSHHDQIVRRWSEQADRAAASRGLAQPALAPLIPDYLGALAQAGDDLGRCVGEARARLEHHLSGGEGLEPAELVEELALLGRCIAATWSGDGGVEPPGPLQLERLFEELQAASLLVTERYADHVLEEEQSHERCLRQIEEVGYEPIDGDEPARRAWLGELLGLVMEAMGARGAALMVCGPEAPEVELEVSVGPAGERLERQLGSLAAGSLDLSGAAKVFEVPLDDAARGDTSGVRALLGIWLRPRRAPRTLLCIALAATQRHHVREAARLDSLAQHLAIHLDDVWLHDQLRGQLRLFDAERELRDRLMSLIAHDLRGPLSAAKMNAELLMRHPERLDERRELAGKIDRHLARTDRMIRDLLEASRIRAGEPLPLQLDACDLSAVAREVREELSATFGDRFVLDVAPAVRGVWSADNLRRALWSLGSHAVKYGASDREITITVRPRPGGGAIAQVHNWGAPLSTGEQALLFEPFTPSAVKEGAQLGWGLGLTLVRACMEAHGGRITVVSSVGRGTTFTLELPLDSRRFQPRSAVVRPALH